VRALLVSDLHYDLRKLDWVLAEAEGVDLLAIAGDMLDIASGVPLDAQIVVLLEYLARFAERTTTIACSGNHDLDSRTDGDEKATRWIVDARQHGVHVDGDSVEVGGWLATACAWWEGPETLASLQASLDATAAGREGPWLWVYHGPPEGPLAWTGSRFFGDPELPLLLDRHRPDVVLCGHIHQAPFVAGGAWFDQLGPTMLFNSGHQRGNIPAHVFLDLDASAASTATWWSMAGAGEVSFAAPVAAARQ
jgi:Icc-related predicted phosphoesterase